MAYTSVDAQNIIKHFTIEDGLPSNEVYYVHQDSIGYIWFCTDRGVSRYDGYEFTNFTVADGLTHNTVFKVFEDHRGDLWFTTHDGSITIFRAESKVFEAFEHNKWLQSKFADQKWTRDIGFNKERNEVYFMMKRNTNTDSIHCLLASGKMRSLESESIIFDSIVFNNLVVSGKYWSDETTTDQVYFSIISPPHNLRKHKLHKELIEKKDLLGPFPNALGIGDEVFFTSYSGLYKMGAEYSLVQVSNEFYTTALLEDQEGLLWVTTLNNGVFLYANKTSLLSGPTFDLSKNEKLVLGKELRGSMVLATNMGNILVTDSSGNLKYNYRNDKIKGINALHYGSDSSSLYYRGFQIQHTPCGFSPILTFEDEFSYRDVEFLNRGELVRTTDTMTYTSVFYNRKGKKSIKNLTYANNLGAFASQCTEKFLERLLEAQKIDDFRKYSEGRFFLADYYYGLDFIYVATNKGLLKFQLDNKVSQYLEFSDIRGSLGISSLKVLNDFTILSSKGHGILVIKDDSLYANLTTKEYLLSDMVNYCYVDQEYEQIWCGTNFGISIYGYTITNGQLSFKKERDITKQDGLYSNYVNNITPLGDKMVAISDHGIAIFSRQDNSVFKTPSVTFFGVQQGDSFYTESDLSFSYLQNNLEFSYGSITNRKVKNMYRYRLVSDQDLAAWSYTDSREIRFNSVAPASYTFQVSARAQNTGWGIPKEYHFTVTPRFIDLWWVRSLGVSALLLVGYLFFTMRLKRIQDKGELLLSNQELELQIAKLESSALRGQMNPHFMFNVLNSIQKLILNEEKKDANKLLARFSKLVRSALQYSRLEYIPLTDETKFLENYMSIEAQRFPGRFTFHIEVDDELLEGATIPPLLIQPLCENAIKHAFVEDGGAIWVRISVKDTEYIRIEVEDDGIGVSNTNTLKKSSLGTTIIRDRVKLIQKTGVSASLKIELADHKTQKGTLATLILPYN